MDVADKTADIQEVMDAAAQEAIRHKAKTMPAGEPGDCDECGEPSPRLVEGICCSCRDRLARYRERTGRR